MFYFLILIIIAVGCVFFFIKKNTDSETKIKEFKSTAPIGTITKKTSILSEYEKDCYSMLKANLPDHIVMCQVSFNALVTAKSMQLRAKFNRLYTDFVVLDQELNVLAIVELDDKSHRRPDVIEKDIARDKILIDAGYKVIRYKKIPTAELIKHDFGVKQDKHLEPDSVN